LNATGYYFDEVANAVSTAPITLNAYSDLSTETVLNVNLLTTLAYQRIQNLVTKSNLSFANASTQAQREVLAALNIPNGSSYGSFGALDISKGTDADNILTAISTLFVYGNTAGQLSALTAAFQSDIGANGVITNAATTTALANAARSVRPGTIASNLTQYYATAGIQFSTADIAQWIDQDGDGVLGKFKFLVTGAGPSSTFSFPSFVSVDLATLSVTASAGELSVNGTIVTGPVTLAASDSLVLTRGTSAFSSTGVLTAYLVSNGKNVARVTFVAANADVWLPNAPLNTPRSLHTATLLQSGQVLVVGGQGPQPNPDGPPSFPTAAELYDPTTNTWDVVGNLVTARQIHTATRLQDGRVLVVGGSNVTVNAIATAEIYDPATKTWSSGGSLSTARSYHTATLLPNGQVLVAGGLTANPQPVTLSSAELYDPSTNSWSSAASLLTARQGHTAVLLQNGMVLVAGGEPNDSQLPGLTSAELYDPSTNTWSPAASMTTGRFDHAMTLLQNGQVIVAGGLDPSNSTDNGSTELYDPVANTWTTVGSLVTPRFGHTATVLPSGKVLVAGGAMVVGSQATDLVSAEQYDPISQMWSPAASLAVPRVYATATLLSSGGVLVTGGNNPNNTDDSETYW
jgi:N-acetylneuraminic acid mutarotase